MKILPELKITEKKPTIMTIYIQPLMKTFYCIAVIQHCGDCIADALELGGGGGGGGGRPPWGQLCMEQYLISLKYWPI